MIDTVRLKFHNIQNYPLIASSFIPYKGSTVDAVVAAPLSVSGQPQAPSLYSFYANSGKFLPISLRKRVNVPSWDYSISVNVADASAPAPCMVVELSFPKFFWGTNLFQFLDFPETSSENCYRKFIRAIGEVQRFLFKRMEIVHDSDIEIERIDFCYNQFFQDKAQAKEYQSAQFDHMTILTREKYAELKHGHHHNWTYVTKRYSFKCYHKGDEFRKHDAEKLRNHLYPSFVSRQRALRSASTQSRAYDMVYLQDCADRILRYEITYRRSMIHYLTQYNTFIRFEWPGGQKPQYILNSNLYKYLRKVDETKNFITYAKGFNVITDNASAVEYFCNHIPSFRLASPFDRPFSPPAVALSPVVTFSYPVFRFLWDNFWQKVREAQIDSRSNFSENLKKVDTYLELLSMRKATRTARKGTPKRKGLLKDGAQRSRLTMIALISAHTDVRQLKDHMPLRTYERLISDVRKAGLPMRTEDMQIVKPGLDYIDYQASLGRLINPSVA